MQSGRNAQPSFFQLRHIIYILLRYHTFQMVSAIEYCVRVQCFTLFLQKRATYKSICFDASQTFISEQCFQTKKLLASLTYASVEPNRVDLVQTAPTGEQEHSVLAIHCLTKGLLKHFSRRQSRQLCCDWRFRNTIYYFLSMMVQLGISLDAYIISMRGSGLWLGGKSCPRLLQTRISKLCHMRRLNTNP